MKGTNHSGFKTECVEWSTNTQQDNYMKKIYIATPFSYDPLEAKQRYKTLCQALTYQHGDKYLYVSTIPLFDYICESHNGIEKTIMEVAEALIINCDELWNFYGSSDGVEKEIDFAKDIGMNIKRF